LRKNGPSGPLHELAILQNPWQHNQKRGYCSLGKNGRCTGKRAADRRQSDILYSLGKDFERLYSFEVPFIYFLILLFFFFLFSLLFIFLILKLCFLREKVFKEINNFRLQQEEGPTKGVNLMK